MFDGISVNKVMLAGRVGTRPQLQRLSNSTRLCYFSLSVLERWTSSDGQPMERNNWFKIEVLGKNAEYAFNSVRKNEWYFVDGYLRWERFDDDKNIVKVRAFSVLPLIPNFSTNGGSNEVEGKTEDTGKET